MAGDAETGALVIEVGWCQACGYAHRPGDPDCVTMTRDAELAELLPAIRERHARHTASPIAGWCREGNTIRVTRCDVGALLEALDRLQALLMVYEPVYEAMVAAGDSLVPLMNALWLDRLQGRAQ